MLLEVVISKEWLPYITAGCLVEPRSYTSYVNIENQLLLDDCFGKTVLMLCKIKDYI